MSRPGIREVASVAEVAIGTVSNFLNHPERACVVRGDVHADAVATIGAFASGAARAPVEEAPGHRADAQGRHAHKASYCTHPLRDLALHVRHPLSVREQPLADEPHGCAG